MKIGLFILSVLETSVKKFGVSDVFSDFLKKINFR